MKALQARHKRKVEDHSALPLFIVTAQSMLRISNSLPHSHLNHYQMHILKMQCLNPQYILSEFRGRELRKLVLLFTTVQCVHLEYLALQQKYVFCLKPINSIL